MSTALGVEVGETIDDIRKAVVATVEEGDTRTALELLSESEYHIYDAMAECEGFAFIAVGRPESAGCYCKINSYLKMGKCPRYMTADKVAERQDYVHQLVEEYHADGVICQQMKFCDYWGYECTG